MWFDWNCIVLPSSPSLALSLFLPLSLPPSIPLPSSAAAGGGNGVHVTGIAVGVVAAVVAILGGIVVCIVFVFTVVKCKQGVDEKGRGGAEMWFRKK